jgi:hypothetical protein
LGHFSFKPNKIRHQKIMLEDAKESLERIREGLAAKGESL